MAFSTHKSGYNGAPPIEYLAAGAIKATRGAAMKLAGGKLALCGATDKPEFICAGERGTVADGTLVPVQRVRAADTYMVTDCPDMSGVNIGDAVTLDANAMTVTATKEGGVITVLEKDDVYGYCIVKI